MHNTAMEHGRRFFETYVTKPHGATIVDLGSQDVNGSLRSVAPAQAKYIGVDFEDAKGVDVVITDPYALPFDDESVDVCVSSSCFEHSEFFWLVFLEVMRVLKPAGLFYLNVPSNGDFHRYPVDCWRFYPDSGIALQNWARRNSYPAALLESFTGKQKTGVWNDFVAVFVKDERLSELYPARIQDGTQGYTNGLVIGRTGFSNPSNVQEDQRAISRRLRKRFQRLLGGPE
jgi:SAM-dependent methyltransferase